MLETIDLEEIRRFIQTQSMVLLYFTGSSCGACHILKEKVEGILKKYPKVVGLEIDGVKAPELAANYEVFTVPIFLLYVMGKESLREGKYVDLKAFEEKVERYYNLL